MAAIVVPVIVVAAVLAGLVAFYWRKYRKLRVKYTALSIQSGDIQDNDSDLELDDEFGTSSLAVIPPRTAPGDGAGAGAPGRRAGDAEPPAATDGAPAGEEAK